MASSDSDGLSSLTSAREQEFFTTVSQRIPIKYSKMMTVIGTPSSQRRIAGICNLHVSDLGILFGNKSRVHP